MATKVAKKRSWTKINRRKYDTGTPADPNDIFFYGYKEPLKKFEGGHGYYGVLSYNGAKDKVQCHFCGLMFRTLGTHVNKEHGLNAREYKANTGLMEKTALVAEGTRITQAKMSHMTNRTPEMEAKRKAAWLEWHRNRRPKQKERYALEHHNLRGSCPDQLLDKVQKLADELGRPPTGEEFRKAHDGRYYKTLLTTFGTWQNALRKLKLDVYREVPTNEKLLQDLRDFYKIHGRTPLVSDFRRGLLHTAQLYYKRFGNMNYARLLAGIPFVIRMHRKYEEWTPDAEQREKMLEMSPDRFKNAVTSHY